MLNLTKCSDLNLSLPATLRRFRLRALAPAEGKAKRDGVLTTNFLGFVLSLFFPFPLC